MVENLTDEERDMLTKTKDWLGVMWEEFLLLGTSMILPEGERLTKKNGWIRVRDDDGWETVGDLLDIIKWMVGRGLDVHLAKSGSKLTLWVNWSSSEIPRTD